MVWEMDTALFGKENRDILPVQGKVTKKVVDLGGFFGYTMLA